MARTITTTRYPLLKFLVPVAVLIFVAGLVVFFMQVPEPEAGLDPQPLLLFAAVAALVAFAGLLWKRKEVHVVARPSDALEGRSREELQGVLDTLDQQRDAGTLSPERYTRARNKVLHQMKRARQ